MGTRRSVKDNRSPPTVSLRSHPCFTGIISAWERFAFVPRSLKRAHGAGPSKNPFAAYRPALISVSERTILTSFQYRLTCLGLGPIRIRESTARLGGEMFRFQHRSSPSSGGVYHGMNPLLGQMPLFPAGKNHCASRFEKSAGEQNHSGNDCTDKTPPKKRVLQTRTAHFI